MMKRLYLLFVMCVISTSVFGMVFDNRFMPLYQKPFTRYCEEPCRLIIQPFTMVAHHSWNYILDPGNSASKEEGPLFSGLYGYYNQVAIDNALQAAGITDSSLLRSDQQLLTSLPWCQRGHFEGHGIALNYDQTVFPHFGYGFSLMCMQVNSRMDMSFKGSASPGDLSELMEVRNRMCQLEGLTPGLFTKFDFGDIDFYLRFGALKEYCLKFRKIDVGVRFGILFPTAQPRPINNPASIYVGGDGHWGVYSTFDTELELKDDLKVGLWARLSHRFAKTMCERIPLAGEPGNFGVLRAPVRIKPGLTGVFMPYFSLEGLRDGFGIKLIYTIVYHGNDCWRPCTNVTIPKAALELVQQQTGWASEYLTVDFMYDFAKDKEYRRFAPCVQLAIDIPFNFIVAKRSFKTFGVSCLIQTDF